MNIFRLGTRRTAFQLEEVLSIKIASIKIRHQKFLYAFFQPKRGVDGDPRGLTGGQGGLWKTGRMTL